MGADHLAKSWRKLTPNLRRETCENALGAAMEEAGPQMELQVKNILVEVQVEEKFSEEAAPVLDLLAAVAVGTERNAYVRDVVAEAGYFPFKLDALQGWEDEQHRLLEYYDVVYSFGCTLLAQQL